MEATNEEPGNVLVRLDSKRGTFSKSKEAIDLIGNQQTCRNFANPVRNWANWMGLGRRVMEILFSLNSPRTGFCTCKLHGVGQERGHI